MGALRRIALAVLVVATFFKHVKCINEYNGCAEHKCEVRLHIESGWLCGRLRRAEDGTVYASFRGVPYGMPPLGPKRFQELEPVVPWDNRILRDATEDGPACPQTDFIYGRLPLLPKGMSEDCIYLNLHVPKSALPNLTKLNPIKKRGLPILVVIHGGALQSGSGLSDILGPEYLMTRKVIVITFNYRLNVFGFLSLNCKEVPGNQGFRDILTLLKWVKRNAVACGGDPDNVTLMGQSAGGTAAHIMALSEAADGFFKRVIMMSGTAFPSYFTTSPKNAKDMANMLCEELGINSTDPTYIHDQLIHMPLLKIMQANHMIQYKTGIMSFNPVVETKFTNVTCILGKHPLVLIEQGKDAKYPQMVSYTDHEMYFGKFILMRKNILGVLQQDRTAIVPPELVYTLPKEQVAAIADKIYEKYLNKTSVLEDLMTFYGDLYFQYGAFKLAQWRAANRGAPMYLSQYSYASRFSPVKAGHWVDYEGAAHMDDLANVFRVNSILGHHLSYPPTDRDDVMKVWMVFMITNFMTCGDPLCRGANTPWPPVSKGRIHYHDVRYPVAVTMSRPTMAQIDMVELFDNFYPQSRSVSAKLGAGWN